MNPSIQASMEKDANNRELGALRVITKCIDEYKLQEEYPIKPLKKRRAQFEKARYDKKRLGQAAKTQAKKPRANGGYAPRKSAAFVDNRQVLRRGPIIIQRREPSLPPYGSSLSYWATTYGGCAATGYQSSTQSNYGNYMGSGVQTASPSYGSYTSSTGQQPHQSYM